MNEYSLNALKSNTDTTTRVQNVEIDNPSVDFFKATDPPIQTLSNNNERMNLTKLSSYGSLIESDSSPTGTSLSPITRRPNLTKVLLDEHANEYDFDAVQVPKPSLIEGIVQSLLDEPPPTPSVKPPSVPSPSAQSPSAHLPPKNELNNEPIVSISTSESAAVSTSGKSITGLVVGTTCLVFFIIAFVTIKKRRTRKQLLSPTKFPSAFENVQAMPLALSKLAPPGIFGRLDSSRDDVEKPNMSGVFKVTRDDPFTRKHMSKGGIWDDPVLVAARIPLEKIEMKELIAHGGFGQVFLASYNGQTVAAKTLLPETAEDMDEINALFVEAKVMATLSHPCIVKFIGIAWESFSSICCVSEYLVGGDLRALLNHFLVNHTRPQGFDHDKVKIALDIAHGLTYLHSMEPNILHRDLKSRNVLLNSQLNAKLTDFGVSRERSDGMMTNAVGTSLWMAPEVMIGGRYDGKADVFSFGILLSELDTHAVPYANVRNASGRTPSETTILRKVAAGELQVEFSPNCPPELMKLAQACIALNPKDRPTANDALAQLKTALTSFEVEEVAL